MLCITAFSSIPFHQKVWRQYGNAVYVCKMAMVLISAVFPVKGNDTGHSGKCVDCIPYRLRLG